MRRVGSDTMRARWIRINLCGSLAVVCTAIVVGTASPSLAQDSVPAAAGNVPPSGEISPTGEYKEGLAVGPWMYYPSIFLGGVYNSNSNQAPSGQAVQGTNKDSGWSARVAPRLIATGTDGAIHSTTLFAVGDFQFFNANTVSADAGFSHNYSPTQDLTLNLNARYTRETSLFTSALNFNNNGSLYNQSPNGPIDPTPTVAVVGLDRKAGARHDAMVQGRRRRDHPARRSGGRSRPDCRGLVGSAYLQVIHGKKTGTPPRCDLERKKNCTSACAR